MTVNVPTIAATATAIGALLVGVAVVQGDTALAEGIAVSAAVMLLNFGLWALFVKRLISSALTGKGGSFPAFLAATKLTGIGVVVWGLVHLYSGLPVLLGGSVVVLSILLHAAVLAVGELRTVSEA